MDLARRLTRRTPPGAEAQAGAGEGESGEKSFLGHLEDLRQTILWAGASLVIGMIVAVPLAPLILACLKFPIQEAAEMSGLAVRTTKITAGISLAMQISFWGGFALAVPGITAAIARFVYPGLLPRERRVVSLGLLSAVFLFVAGVALCYLTTLKPAMHMMNGVNQWMGAELEFVDLEYSVGFCLRVLLSFGLAFELPVVVVALGAVGVVNSAFLREKRRHAIVLIMIAAMVLTPTTDPLSMMLMGVPLVLLFEGCIWIIRGMERRSAG